MLEEKRSEDTIYIPLPLRKDGGPALREEEVIEAFERYGQLKNGKFLADTIAQLETKRSTYNRL